MGIEKKSEKVMNPLYTTPISSREEAEAFYRGMSAEGKLFHPDDSPETIINNQTGLVLFTLKESAEIVNRVNETYVHLDGNPCAFIVANEL